MNLQQLIYVQCKNTSVGRLSKKLIVSFKNATLFIFPDKLMIFFRNFGIFLITYFGIYLVYNLEHFGIYYSAKPGNPGSATICCSLPGLDFPPWHLLF